MVDFDRIVHEYGGALARVTSSYEADPVLREDLLQDIFLALHVALPKLRDEDRLAPFIFRIAHNRGVSHVVRRVAEKRSLGQGVAQVQPSPEDALLESERSTRLMAAIRRLPLPYRQVMVLVLEELPYADIAEALGLSVSNVGVRINRAKAQLKAMLDHG